MNNLPEFQNTKEWYLSNFKSFEEKVNGQSKTFFHELRKKAFLKLSELNFPSTHQEEWKYTNVSPILKQNFVPAQIADFSLPAKSEIEKFLFTGFDSHLLVFVNGIFNEELSNISELPSGVYLGSLKNAVVNSPNLVENYLSKYAEIENAFNALNLIYASDGLTLVIPDGVIVGKPVQLLFINGDYHNQILSQPRNLIIAGKNSQVSLIANYCGSGDMQYFTNAVTEIFVGESSIVDFYKIQNENEDSFHIEKVQVYQQKGSVFNHYNFGFGGGIVRNDINSKLDGENIETHYYGLYLANNKQHVDNHTFVDHAKPYCMSNELYKGILDGSARGVFNGKIIVRKDAQKTNAYQQNKTILLSKTARVDAKPQLEIFADDVRCTHGATVGHLDDTADFYIRSRGIPEEIAKSMLIRAFANDVVEVVKIDAIKEKINHMIFEHLNRAEIVNSEESR